MLYCRLVQPNEQLALRVWSSTDHVRVTCCESYRWKLYPNIKATCFRWANLMPVCVFRVIIGLHEEEGQQNGPVYSKSNRDFNFMK